jgi:hypothetical protein
LTGNPTVEQAARKYIESYGLAFNDPKIFSYSNGGMMHEYYHKLIGKPPSKAINEQFVIGFDQAVQHIFNGRHDKG